MAAHMQRALSISCVRVDKARILRSEHKLFQPFISQCMSVSSDGSPPSKGSSQGETTEPESLNQTNVTSFSTLDHTRPDISRDPQKKLPTLLKPAFKDANSSSSFSKLLRDSNFVHLGSPRGRVVLGTIFRVVDNDLYVDFDWKFPCVVKRPAENAHLYVNNAVVRLRIIDLELSTIFLGAEKETSLNEANCVLMGLISSPLGVPSKENARV